VLTAWARDQGLPADVIDDIRLATYEALANTIQHAYPLTCDGTMTLTATLDTDGLVISVADRGRWRTGFPHGHGGRGLLRMRAIVPETRVTTTPAGTTVELTWPRPRETHQQEPHTR